MLNQFKNFKVVTFSLMLIVAAAAISYAQGGRVSDPFTSLKRAITQAGAPALSTTQETALTALVSEFKAALPDEGDDDTLETAREAYDAAIIAGDLAAAQVQITIITTRMAQLQDARMQAQARYAIAALTVLKSGGQYDPLVAKYGSDRAVSLVMQLIGRGGQGSDGPGGGRR
jgi:hypothetical protein